jgi:hypothetical protein
MKFKQLFCISLLLATSPLLASDTQDSPALKDTVILVIRHAEKPDSGFGLSPLGEQRAQLYVNYFKNFTIDSTPLKPDYIFATADSKGSHRPRLTVEPTAKALGLAIDNRFSDKDFQKLADEIRSKPHGRVILIAWHHGEIPQLVQALGADANKLIPDAKWPTDVFGWLIELRYDAAGHLVENRCINEKLMPDDDNKPPGKS